MTGGRITHHRSFLMKLLAGCHDWFSNGGSQIWPAEAVEVLESHRMMVWACPHDGILMYYGSTMVLSANYMKQPEKLLAGMQFLGSSNQSLDRVIELGRLEILKYHKFHARYTHLFCVYKILHSLSCKCVIHWCCACHTFWAVYFF